MASIICPLCSFCCCPDDNAETSLVKTMQRHLELQHSLACLKASKDGAALFEMLVAIGETATRTKRVLLSFQERVVLFEFTSAQDKERNEFTIRAREIQPVGMAKKDFVYVRIGRSSSSTSSSSSSSDSAVFKEITREGEEANVHWPRDKEIFTSAGGNKMIIRCSVSFKTKSSSSSLQPQAPQQQQQHFLPTPPATSKRYNPAYPLKSAMKQDPGMQVKIPAVMPGVNDKPRLASSLLERRRRASISSNH